MRRPPVAAAMVAAMVAVGVGVGVAMSAVAMGAVAMSAVGMVKGRDLGEPRALGVRQGRRGLLVVRVGREGSGGAHRRVEKSVGGRGFALLQGLAERGFARVWRRIVHRVGGRRVPQPGPRGVERRKRDLASGGHADDDTEGRT
ncbi:hypothetical protein CAUPRSCDRAFT_11137 [Caulochytrium protostelioides]|uniref:Uncharacterized protein n=1 Tax=Caulochytrium protostelioides TaxID=1555241 RepID=A0A4P9WUX5_9FUNG|nr:hypothetical protein CAUPRSCDRAFT_11137 [Caulochytrium protostelioides]